MSLIGTSSVNDLPNITGSSDADFDNITTTNISVSNKISFEEADANDEGNMTTYIYQDPTTNDIVVNNNNPLGSFRLQYGNTPDTNVLSFEIDSYNQKLNFPVGVNSEYNISFEELYALKGVNINQSIQQQINSINQISQGTGYWGTFSSSIDQTFATADTAQIATLNTADANNNGIVLFNQSGANYNSVKVLNGATYNVQIVFQVSSSSSSSGLVRTWVRLNGTDLPNSSAGIKEHSNNGYLIISYNLILQLIPNDVLTFMIAGSNTTVHLEAIPAQASPFVCPASPSVYISIQQITYYQKAELQNIYGLFQLNTTMTDASPNYVGVKWQSGFNLIRLPDATITPLGKEYTFFMVNPIPVGAGILVNTYSISQYFYYFGFSDNNSIELTSQTQSFVFTCISNSTNPYWSINQVEYDPTLFFNLDAPNLVPYATIFTQTGTTNPAIQMRPGTYLSLEGNLLVNSATITPVELSYLDGATSNIQGQLNNRATLDSAQTISGAKTFSGTTTLTGNVIANSLTITPTEMGYLDGATSNIQSQLSSLQQKTSVISYNTTTGTTVVGGSNFECENLYVNQEIYQASQNIANIYEGIGVCYTKAESNVFNQRTTAMTYQASPERTTFSNGIVCGTLNAINYIFVNGIDIYNIYSPRGLSYTKTESDNRYFSLSLGNSLQDTINGILQSIASIIASILSLGNDIYNLTIRVSNTETAIDNLETDVNTLTSGVGTLTTQVNNAVSDITGLENITQNLTANATSSTFSGNFVVMGGSTTVGALIINGDNFNDLLQNQW